MKILFKLLLAAGFVFVVDWITKVWAEATLGPFQPVSVIGDVFRLTLGYNTGVAFGMLANGGSWPLLLTGVIIVGLIVWLGQALFSGQFPPQAAWAVGLLLGGAVGNFVDRWPDGRVTDFLDFGIGPWRWPTFNLADSFILIGVGLLVLLTFNYHPEAAAGPDEAQLEGGRDPLLSQPD